MALEHEAEGSHTHILLGLTASLSGVETCSFSCLLSQLLLPAKRWWDKVGLYSRLSGAQPAVLPPAHLRWQGELKCQFCYWSNPNQRGLAAEPLPRFIRRSSIFTLIVASG